MSGFENVEVGTPEASSAPVGQVSFSEVEEVSQKVEAEAKAEKAEVSKVAEKVAEKVAKKLEKADEAEAVAEPVAAPETAQAQAAKALKAYDAEGKTVDLNPDLELEFKVDGKTEKMKLAEVRNHLSGKVNWDRKNNELFQQRKRFEDQVNFVNEQVDKIMKMANEKPEAALFELARLAGKSPDEYAKMLAGSIEGANRWSDMSDLERKAAMTEAENFAYRQDMERRKAAEEAQQKESERVNSIKALATDLSLSENDIQELSEDLRVHAKIAQPTSDNLMTAWVYKNTAAAFQSIAPEVIQQDPSLFDQTAMVLLSNGIRSKEEIEQVIRQAYGEEDSARKVGRKVTSQTPKTASAATSQGKAKEVVSFDDL
jgi:hypothetical protein